jgi:hypothetical protein
VNLFPLNSYNASCYFAPLLLRVPETDTLVALAEARLFSCDDAGAKRIAMRRSVDGGRSWAPTRWIWNDTALAVPYVGARRVPKMHMDRSSSCV